MVACIVKSASAGEQFDKLEVPVCSVMYGVLTCRKDKRVNETRRERMRVTETRTRDAECARDSPRAHESRREHSKVSVQTKARDSNLVNSLRLSFFLGLGLLTEYSGVKMFEIRVGHNCCTAMPLVSQSAKLNLID